MMKNQQQFESTSLPTQTPLAIKKICSSKKISNATLLFGPDIDHIYNTMIDIANALNNCHIPYETPVSDNIQELALDVLVLNPEGRQIKIDTIKSIQPRMKYGASTNQFCIIIIHQINKLTNTSANALLKSIEEPPKNTIFLFSSLNKDQVIGTILSRCQSIYIPMSSDFFHKKNQHYIDTLEQSNVYITPFDFLHLSNFDQLHYIQKLPNDVSLIEILLISWQLSLTSKLTTLSQKEHRLLEKTIEIISKITYNLNLKLQLASLMFNLEED